MAKKKTAKKAAKKLDPDQPIYQLKISLDDIAPAIWRRVQVDECSLADLHEIIQSCMDWDDDHMHVFQVGRNLYSALGEMDADDAAEIRLSDLVRRNQLRFTYEYDFGDSWRHTIAIEKTLPPKPGVRYPRCIAGKRATPPEDSGGPFGYDNLLDILEDPEHEEHEDVCEWLGEGFDPERFDLESINEQLEYTRRFLGDTPGKNAPNPAFAKGDFVCVNPGVVHLLFGEISLAGWEGKIVRTASLTPPGYEVEWTKATRQRMPAGFGKRCKERGHPQHIYWLEEGEFELAAGIR